MRYFKRFKEINAKTIEITKERAYELLSGYWNKDMLEDIFTNERSFRLYTPFSVIWTKDENGRTPMAGFYGFID